MSVAKRQDEILQLVRARDRMEVDDLAGHFGVTAQTIRHDLRELDQQGLLRRTHGGAHKLDTVTTRDYAERRRLRGTEKRDIGRLAAALVPNACSVMLNIGTTTEQVALALREHTDMMVISNNINIITQLSGSASKTLVLAGGRVRQSDGAVVGEDAVAFISQYRVDFAIIGCSSLDADGTVLDFDMREVSVARAILRNSRQKILVADSAKFEVDAPVRICDIAEIDYFVTNAAPPGSFQRAARQGQTHIITPEGKI
jgi:DeoR family glycerol-3-phosphate regulon repressor